MEEPQVIVGEVGTVTWLQTALLRILAAFSAGRWSIFILCDSTVA